MGVKNLKFDSVPWLTYVPDPTQPSAVVIHTTMTPDDPVRYLALVSDVHIDSAEHDAALWDYCMDEIMRRRAGVLINGDLLDAMGSRNDPRRDDFHRLEGEPTDEYYDRVVATAHKGIERIADNLLVMGIGNHDLTKHMETNLLRRIVRRINTRRQLGEHNQNKQLMLGKQPRRRVNWGLETMLTDYITSVRIETTAGTSRFNHNILMYHGLGGGGRVSQGLQWRRDLASMYPGFDVYWCGHWHNCIVHPFRQEKPGKDGTRSPFLSWWVQTPSFKNSAETTNGWDKNNLLHMKPRGMIFLKLQYIDTNKLNRRRQVIITPEPLVMP